MTPFGLLAAVAAVVAFGASVILILPTVRRTGLGIVHPLIAWLALQAVFFTVGVALLSATGAIAPGPGWYVAGATLATALGVAASDRLADRRERPASQPSGPVRAGTADPAPVRPAVVVILLAVALALVAPGLLGTGLPLLADDPTGARTELAGLVVQPLRIFLPAVVIVALIATLRRPTRPRIVALGAVLTLALSFTLLLASRYLAAELAAAVVVAWILAGRRIDRRAVVGLGLAGLLVFGGVQVVRAPGQASGRELAFAMERTISRVVLIQPRTLDALMDAVPADTPWFMGLTWLRRVAPLVGRDDVPNLGYWIYPRIFPDQAPGIVGYAAPGLIGEAWVNLGIVGLGLFALLGVVLERLGDWLMRHRTGTADIAAGALAVVVLARTHALGVNGTAVLLVLLVAWRLVASGDARSLLRGVADAVASRR